MREESFVVCTNLLLHAGHHVIRCVREISGIVVLKHATAYYAELLGLETPLHLATESFDPAPLTNAEFLRAQGFEICMKMSRLPSGVDVEYTCHFGDKSCKGRICYVA